MFTCKIGLDTEENETLKVWRSLTYVHRGLNPSRTTTHHCSPSIFLNVHFAPHNFEELVLGCIKADFCNQIPVGKILKRSLQSLHSVAPLQSQNVSNYVLQKFLPGKLKNEFFEDSVQISEKGSPENGPTLKTV